MNILKKLENKPVPQLFKEKQIKINKHKFVNKQFIPNETLEDFLKRTGLPRELPRKNVDEAKADEPKAEQPEAKEPKEAEQPEQPKAEQPEQPKAEQPEQPKAKEPEQPKAKEPEAKEAKEHKEAAPPKPQRRTRKQHIHRVAPIVADPKTTIRKLNEYITAKRPQNTPISFYLSNRKLFLQKIDAWFKETPPPTRPTEFELLAHQRIVRDYLSLSTPYRGLLLFHGLGSGKTCTSIAVAEGLKDSKRIFLFIPASLETNFYNEIRKCGDTFYTKKQFWYYLSIDADTSPETIDMFSQFLHLSKTYLKKRKGVWIMDPSKPSNYDALNPAEQEEIQDQLDEMIRRKYHQINYNASNLKRVLTELPGKNPFDHSVVIVDEAHKLVSMIVNRINSHKKNGASQYLYELLLNAVDVRIVLLTGTPQVNYPNEIAILFNMLRGNIKTWEYSVRSALPTRDQLLEMLVGGGNLCYDYVSIDQGKIRITRNPYGFVNQYETGLRGGRSTRRNFHLTNHNKTKKQYGGANEFARYRGVMFDAENSMTDQQFETSVTRILKKNKITIQGDPMVASNLALPEHLESFVATFLDMQNLEYPQFLPKREIVFKKRIMGLGSYFLPQEDAELPQLLLSSNGDVMHYEYCPMSDFQFSIYSDTRLKEYETAQKMKKKRVTLGENADAAETVYGNSYRIYSRCNCNYVFPLIHGKPGRPLPHEPKPEDEDNNENEEEENEFVDGESVAEDGTIKTVPKYKERIETAMNFLMEHHTDYLEKEALNIYSPKFRRMLDNISNVDHRGLHLVYSQFRTLEGIGILRMVLLTHGYRELSVRKSSNGEWELNLSLEDNHPRFILYTGTETIEERELLRNIYNGEWEELPSAMKQRLQSIAPNNNYGEIAKVIMITGSSAEGINLRNTRFVHLMEPFWHYVRLQQVIGRARRFRSHLALPPADRNVKVFLYLAVFSQPQLDKMHEIGEGVLIKSEASRRDPNQLFTSDQALYEISDIKMKVAEKLLTAIRETSIDCRIHNNKNETTCFTLGNIVSQEFASKPTIEEDILDSQGEEMRQRIVKKFKDRELYYYADEGTRDEYDIFSSKQMEKKIGVYNKALKKYIPLK